MKKIDNFINEYPLSKTLRFQLKPVGKTEENFEKKLMLEKDEQRAEDYAKVKVYLDRYYRKFINETLSKINLEGLDEYETLYMTNNRSKNEEERFKKVEENLRKQIAKGFQGAEGFANLTKKEIIRDILPNFLTDEQELKEVQEFYNFTTYFKGFFDNRKNIFTEAEQSTGAAYRCINDNLPKFMDNIKSFKILKNILPEDLDQVSDNMFDFYSEISDISTIDDVFDARLYSRFLSQTSIEIYNKIIGGYAFSDGTKIQGINEVVNLYNQKNKTKLPLLKPLFKQILSENESISFIPETFKSDNELLNALNELYVLGEESISEAVKNIKELFSKMDLFDLNGIYIASGVAITDLSQSAYGNWNAIRDAWNKDYDKLHMKKKITDAYYEKQAKEYKAVKSFSLETIEELTETKGNLATYYSNTVSELCKIIEDKYETSRVLLTSEYNEKKRLSKNETAIALIKDFLDSIKNLEKLVKPLTGTGKEFYKDETFYGQFLPIMENIQKVDKVYDKTRNYLTQKPYSKDKIKLNFDNPQLLGGWDRNKETDYRCVLLRDKTNYYLGIMDKGSNKAFEDKHFDGEKAFYEKMKYKLLPDPSKMLPKVFFAKSNMDYFNPSNEIIKIRETESYKKGDNFDINDLREFIDFYKKSISIHPDWKEFGFTFTDTEKYENIGEFFREVKNQGYSLNFEKISKNYVDELVEKGKLYLFQIYNKDFSEYSKGVPNLHTMYFKILFDEHNLADTVFKLNGEAEMFYRKASISEAEKIIHPANTAVKNKNPLNAKKESEFSYDIIKDKRFTKRSFMLHVPITLNFHADGQDYINDKVRKYIRECDKNYVIGIDRGERNLLYVCVIDETGKIVEQFSLNEIISEHNHQKHVVDYHLLLDEKEKERDKARQNWTTVENIKELKEGYLSQVIHKICELVEKYDAIIALEDLNGGFKNSRKKVEKQVYQKFEKQLIDKLNFMVNKQKKIDETGGLLQAYQLANNGLNYKGTQNGFIFYVPAWLTSKIDPVTGFVNLLNPKYTSVKEAQEFFGKFEKIGFNSDENVFEFTFDYSNFPKGLTDYQKKWTICSYGERIKTFRNSNKNNEWDNETVVLTDKYKELFDKFNIPCDEDMKDKIVSMESKDFFEDMIGLFKLTLQMRNSITGNIEEDYIISPVRGNNGKFYNSNEYKQKEKAELPKDADANGAYNIARKALYMIDIIKQSSEEEYAKTKLTITNKDWLKYTQSND